MIVPAILEKSTNKVTEKVRLVSGLTDYVQLDIIADWPSADNTVSLQKIAKENILHKIQHEVHLMTASPIKYLPYCQQIGTKLVIAQVEHVSDQLGFVGACHKLGLQAGLALDLPTFLGTLERKTMYELDCCLLMSVKAGAQGQKFNNKTLGKLKRLARLRKNLGRNFVISIDGGIYPEIGKQCLAYGADRLCVGSYLLQAKDIKSAWIKFKDILNA